MPMRERLRFLYGEAAGDRAHEELEALMRDFRGHLGARPAPREPFDERDVLLITYGDTFASPGQLPLAALRAFAERHLLDLFSGIHLLPFFPYSSDYGFSVVDYLEVDPALGTWRDVEALHGSFELMFDFVLNHVSAESEWFRGFLRGEEPYQGFFIAVDPLTDLSGVARPRTTPLLTRFETARGSRWVWTTFGPDQVDLDYSNPRVLVEMARVMLTYVERGAGLLRLDAVGYLWKEVGTSCLHLPQTHEVVKLLREVLDACAPDVLLVTETNVPHRENVAYFGEGSDEAQMVYQFPLAPLVLDACARGDAGHLVEWAGGLSTPSPRTAFFNFLASHDGIGVVPAAGLLDEAEIEELVRRVRAHGGEVSYRATPGGGESPYELNCTLFDALSDPRDVSETWELKRDRFLGAQAIMLALAGVPGIYVHSLFGSHNDRAGYARSGWKRDLNHGRLDLAEVERVLADPSSEAGQVFAGLRKLLEARRAHPAFHPGAPQRVPATVPGCFAVLRGPRAGRSVLALHSLAPRPQTVPEEPFASRGLAGPATDLLTGRPLRLPGPIKMGPYEVLWLDLEPS